MKIRVSCLAIITVMLFCSSLLNTAFSQEELKEITQKDYETWMELANEGDPDAQYRIGLLYQDGAIVEQNSDLAFEWFSKSSKGGNAAALTNVGVYYANGIAVERDLVVASTYYKLAADKEYPRGMMNLASAYLSGRGVARDAGKAITLLTQAAELGYAQAQSTLGTVYQHGIGVKEDYKKSFKWLSKSHDQGFAQGTYGLAGLYANGSGAKKDTVKAYELYQQGANKGHLPSIYNVGVAYRDGMKPVGKNLKKAAIWFKRGAEAGHPSSQYALGLMMVQGQGIPESRADGMALIAKSAMQGYTPAVELIQKFDEVEGDETESANEQSNAVETQSASAEDVLTEIWASKELIIAYFDTCASQVPEELASILKFKKEWTRKNAKINKNVEKFMRSYFEKNKDGLGSGQTIDSALAELRSGFVNTVEEQLNESSEKKALICKNLRQPLGEIIETYQTLYKENRKRIKKEFK